jgi:hypothetical protein
MSPETPAQARSNARVHVAKLLRGALHDADIDQADLARLCGTSPQKVQRWCDRQERETPYAADLAQMPRSVALPLLRWAAEQHHALVVDHLEAASALDHMGHLHRVLAASAAVSVAYAAALADGVIDAVERERLTAALRASICAHESVLVLLENEGRPARLEAVR